MTPNSTYRADAATARGSPERFGFEWNEYSELRPEYELQFRRWTTHLQPGDWRGKSFLDVGCGMGRNSFWPLQYGAVRGVSIDIDQLSLNAARRTLSPFPNSTVLEASAYNIPFADEFDIVFAIGVIHHLEYPERALQQMVLAARPGGQVLIWVYGCENNQWIVSFIDPLRKAFFSQLPIRALHHLSLYPTTVLWCALRLGWQQTEYSRLLRGLSFRHVRSIVFDQLLPRTAYYWSRDTVEQLMSNTGLADIRLSWVNETSWSAIGTKATTTVNSADSTRTPNTRARDNGEIFAFGCSDGTEHGSSQPVIKDRRRCRSHRRFRY
jgi:SAM-dependent methyltransferase